MCRTCGQGFGSSVKRNKHILSNACVRDKVVKNYECSVCKKRFSTRKSVVAHETWCLYKQRRDANLKGDEEASIGVPKDNGELRLKQMGDGALAQPDIMQAHACRPWI